MWNDIIRKAGDRQRLDFYSLPEDDDIEYGDGNFVFDVGQKVIVIVDDCPIHIGTELEIKQRFISRTGWDKYYCGGVWLNRHEIKVI